MATKKHDVAKAIERSSHWTTGRWNKDLRLFTRCKICERLTTRKYVIADIPIPVKFIENLKWSQLIVQWFHLNVRILCTAMILFMYFVIVMVYILDMDV